MDASAPPRRAEAANDDHPVFVERLKRAARSPPLGSHSATTARRPTGHEVRTRQAKVVTRGHPLIDGNVMSLTYQQFPEEGGPGSPCPPPPQRTPQRRRS